METPLNPDNNIIMPETASPLKVVMVGAGNVASALAPALDRLDGVEVTAVWSRTATHAEELAKLLSNAHVTGELSDIPSDADLYLLSVTDDAIPSVAQAIKCGPQSVAAHTSGGVDASVLGCMTPHYGVLYPLQTFTKGEPVDLATVPLFVEGSDSVANRLLESLAKRITPLADYADSHRRAVMHAAAVFACNFTNHFLARADDILRSEGLTLDVLRPLIAETIRKSSVMDPRSAQTGPARRNDTGCIAHHEALLTPDQRTLYHTVSQSIIDYYHSKKSD